MNIDRTETRNPEDVFFQNVRSPDYAQIGLRRAHQSSRFFGVIIREEMDRRPQGPGESDQGLLALTDPIRRFAPGEQAQAFHSCCGVAIVSYRAAHFLAQTVSMARRAGFD